MCACVRVHAHRDGRTNAQAAEQRDARGAAGGARRATRHRRERRARARRADRRAAIESGRRRRGSTRHRAHASSRLGRAGARGVPAAALRGHRGGRASTRVRRRSATVRRRRGAARVREHHLDVRRLRGVVCRAHDDVGVCRLGRARDRALRHGVCRARVSRRQHVRADGRLHCDWQTTLVRRDVC